MSHNQRGVEGERRVSLTDLSTRHWPSVAVAVALTALFGATSIASLPIQLLPTIEEPQVSVANFWRAAAPEEMEANIVELTDIRRTVGPTQLLRVDGQRTLTLSVTPPLEMTVQEALATLREEIDPALRARMPKDVSLQ